MSKHTSWKTKYHYIMRYKNAESKWTIVNELVERGLIKRSKQQRDWNHTFNNWLHTYEKMEWKDWSVRLGGKQQVDHRKRKEEMVRRLLKN